jgi:hypothetical protein
MSKILKLGQFKFIVISGTSALMDELKYNLYGDIKRALKLVFFDKMNFPSLNLFLRAFVL